MLYRLNLTRLENEDSSPFDAKRLKKLTNYPYSRIAMPRWDHQGQRVVFSYTNRKGVTTLPILEIATRKISFQIRQGHLQAAPVWSENDQAILFSSDHSGVSNIYRFDLNSHDFKPVTHVLGGAFLPTLAPQSQRLYFQNYITQGLELAYMPWKPGEHRAEPLPTITSTWYFNADLAKIRDQSLVYWDTSPSKPYDSLQQLIPQYWFIYGNEEPDRYAWGLIAAGEDPLLNHSYFGSLTMGKDKSYHQFSYTNDQGKAAITFNSSLLPRRYPYGLGVPRLWETIHEAGVTFSFKLDGQWDYGGGWLYRYQEPFDDDDFVDSVNEKLIEQLAESSGEAAESFSPLFERTRDYFNTRTFVGKRQGVHGFVSYSNLKHYPLSISEEKGSIFSLSFTRFPAYWGNRPQIRVIDGNDFDRVLKDIKKDNPDAEGLTTDQKETFISQLKKEEELLSNEHTLVVANYTTFLPVIWKHHVLKLSMGKGLNLNQNESQAMFTTGYDIPLRGYRKHIETAQQFSAISLEWQLPLVQIFRGEIFLPVYYRQFHMGFFYDYASFSGDFQSTNVAVGDEIFYLRDTLQYEIRRSAGVEFKLLTYLGYRYPINLILRFSNAIDINEIFGVDDEKPLWVELDYGLTF